MATKFFLVETQLPHEVLGISVYANIDEIKTAYRKLIKQWHPDVCSDKELGTQKFREINAAYETLIAAPLNKTKSRQHDEPGVYNVKLFAHRTFTVDLKTKEKFYYWYVRMGISKALAEGKGFRVKALIKGYDDHKPFYCYFNVHSGVQTHDQTVINFHNLGTKLTVIYKVSD